MNDYFLRAADEASLWSALDAAGLVNDEHQPVGVSLTVIGPIYKPTGEMQIVDGIEQPVMAPVPGYHANLRGELTAEQVALLPLVPEPVTPYRVWA